MEHKSLDMHIEYLFPTPIGIIEVPNTFFKVTKYLEEFPHKDEEGENSNVLIYGSRSKNSYILNSPQFENFKNFIISNINYFGQNILNIVYPQYSITQSWVSYKHPNEKHIEHTHPNSLISGVFYWELKDDSLPKINFHKSEISNTFSLVPKRVNGELPNPILGDTITYPIKPGMIFLFPSYLAHSVSINKTNQIRKSLAFNSVPKNGIGDESSLTEFKYNI